MMISSEDARPAWATIGPQSSGKAERQSAKCGDVSAPVARMLAFLMQRHRVKTCACIAADARVSVDAVMKWTRGDGVPSLAAFWALFEVHGLDLLLAMCGSEPLPDGLAQAIRAADLRRLERLAGEVEAMLALAKARADL